VLNYSIPRYFISINMTLNNFDGFIDPMKHMENGCSILEMVMQDTNITYKILLTIFCGSSQTWYYNLEFRFILNFKDLYAKLKTHFNINIPTIKSSAKLFTITQQEDEVTIIYLKRFKKKILKFQVFLNFLFI
jgi:hypothetical protein